MNARDVFVEGGIAVLSFFIVGALVTELLRDRIWPSLFVGIPVGLVAGVIVFAVAHHLRGHD